MRKHISYAVMVAAIAAGLSVQVQGVASEAPTVEAQDNFFSFLHGRGRGDRMFAKLEGENEIPAVSTVARGRFSAEIDEDSVEWELSFEGLQGTITQAHIHFGQTFAQSGGIMVWLCGTGAPGTPLAGPAGTQTCPQSGTISGTITAAEVIGPGGNQQLAAGEFAEFVTALKKELAYANVHTNLSGPGEIRGQIKRWSHR
jgi:hypothetical protein